MMSNKRRGLEVVGYIHRLSRLGTRMIVGCIAAFIAAMLIFSAAEIGVAGAIGGVIVGGISAVLVKPHA
ncbi:MAG TPA: hypothetical protein VFE38_08895 [Edaphobacter sp.]|nr:hypothetical protein [Edaphobacter sp.]